MTDTPTPNWRKSSRSGNGNDCVEVATHLVESAGEILVRDSKNPDAAPLRFTKREWAAFIGGVHDGEFDQF